MKSSHWSFAVLFVGLIVGYFVGSGSGERPANAQAPTPAAGVGRYQLDAYNTGPEWGCYVVDTVTGQLWVSNEGHAPVRSGDKLP